MLQAPPSSLACVLTAAVVCLFLLLSLTMQLPICLWALHHAAQAKGCAISHAREMHCCSTASSLT
jgi:hypothetical protein